jgi:penicillin-binding protein 2
MDNPKIAVAAYVENGGFGATWAAPIASLLVEKYLNGEISDKRKYLETRVLEGDLMDRVRVK